MHDIETITKYRNIKLILSEDYILYIDEKIVEKYLKEYREAAFLFFKKAVEDNIKSMLKSYYRKVEISISFSNVAILIRTDENRNIRKT